MKHFTWMWYSISMFCFWQIFSSAACDYNCYTENSSPPSEKRGPANGVQSVSNQPTSGSDRQQSALAWVSPSMVAPSQRYPVPPTVYHLWCISIHSNLAVSDRSVETSGGFSAKISTPGDIRVGLLKYGPQRFSWIFLYFLWHQGIVIGGGNGCWKPALNLDSLEMAYYAHQVHLLYWQPTFVMDKSCMFHTTNKIQLSQTILRISNCSYNSAVS